MNEAEKAAPIGSASVRARMSAAPPAPAGTTTRTGFTGQACALAGSIGASIGNATQDKERKRAAVGFNRCSDGYR